MIDLARAPAPGKFCGALAWPIRISKAGFVLGEAAFTRCFLASGLSVTQHFRRALMQIVLSGSV
jgi:hypothetical protein